MAKLLNKLGRKAKKVAIIGGTLLTLGAAWGGYTQFIAEPEVYIEYEIDKHQKEVVTIENKLVYTTEVGHKKVLLFMGGYYERTQNPGLNFRIPFFEKAYDVDVERVVKLERGYRTKKAASKTIYSEDDFSKESIMVTGDEGELEVQYVVQFRKKNANQFLFNVKKPIETVDEVTASALREVIAKTTYDDALTVGKAKIAKEATELAQEVLDEYKTGIELIGILLQPINPPTEDVKKAFNDINRARQDQETFIEKAGKKYEKGVREALGTKQQIIEQAQGEANEMVNEATGEVAGYLELYEGYKQAPGPNRLRLYHETMRRFLGNADLTIVDKDAKGVLQHLMLDKKGEGGEK